MIEARYREPNGTHPASASSFRHVTAAGTDANGTFSYLRMMSWISSKHSMHVSPFSSRDSCHLDQGFTREPFERIGYAAGSRYVFGWIVMEPGRASFVMP